MSTARMPPNAEQMMAEALKSSMPGLRTQAQYNAFLVSFDAFRVYLNAIFSSDKAGAIKAKENLDLSFHVAEQITEVAEKLREVPEAATGKAAEAFKNAPTNFTEYDTQKRLTFELSKIEELEALTSWYQQNRSAIDEVTSPSLRNPLLDAIRAKRNSLTPSQES